METFGSQRTIYTVSDLSRRIRDLIERNFGDIWIEGEVSNLRRSGAGHIYFTLKDRDAQIPAVCFRSAAMYLRFKPRAGESFRVRGRLTTYEPRGEYQVVVEVLEPAGRGALQEAFERLKAKLDAEGLFDPARKRPLPPFPSRIGIVTSPGSAALRDIISVLDRRHDRVDLLIHPTEVQGDGAAAQIAAGVTALGEAGVDVIIVTRGGGSIEDLWPFNDERVARAISRCPRPVVSAVGHETDFTISDFVADVRAATPSAAAEIVSSTKREMQERVLAAEDRLRSAMRYRMSELRRFLATRVGGRGFVVAENRIRQMVQRVDDCAFRLERFVRSGPYFIRRAGRLEAADRQRSRAIERIVSSARERLASAARTLDALSPLAVLERGYAVCRHPSGRVVRSALELERGSAVEVLLHEGELVAEVRETRRERR